MEDREEGGRILIGGDFNARTGNKGGRINKEDEEEEIGRTSKDGKINGEGKKLIKFIREKGWAILNGEMEGDKEGEWTYTGSRGKSVIDYVIVSEEIREEIMRMEVGDQVDSDHHPVKIKLREGKKERERKRSKGKRTKGVRGKWNEEEREWFRTEIERMGIKEGKVQETIRETLGRMEEEGGRGGRYKGKGWWDEECAEQKRVVRRALRKWRKGRDEEQGYKEEKKVYKEICEKKKREENEKWEKEAEEARTEVQVWNIVNRERKKWKGINKERKEWERYFRGMLGGVERKVVRGGKVRRGLREEGGLEKAEI